MEPFVAIIGGSKSGKSTVICSLTGCETHGSQGVVTDRESNREIYVIAHSPQESGLSLEDLRAILNQVSDSNTIFGVVIAIQPTRPRSHLSMETIFDLVTLTGSYESFAIMLDPPYSGHGARADVEGVRTRLQAKGIELNVLDGRRFAHLNACEVGRITGLP